MSEASKIQSMLDRFQEGIKESKERAKRSVGKKRRGDERTSSYDMNDLLLRSDVRVRDPIGTSEAT